MARFGRSFVQAATQPQYAQGLFTAAQQMGAAPGRRRQAQKTANLQKGLFGLEQSALAGELTPEMYKEAVGSYTALMQQNPEQADEIRKSLARVGASVREQDKAQKKVTAVNQLSAIETEYTNIFSDPSLDASERNARATALRTRAKAIQDANPLVDFSSFSNWDARAMNAGMSISSRVQEKENEAERERVRANLDARTAEERVNYIQNEYNGPLADYAVRYANTRNAFDENVRRIEEEASNREKDFTTDVEDIRSQIANFPEKIKESIETDLKAVENMQQVNRKNNRWLSGSLQQDAANRLKTSLKRVINYTDSMAVADERSIQDAEIKINALTSQIDNPPANEAQLKRLAGLAAIDGGENKAFVDLNPKKQQEYLQKARQTQLENHNNRIKRDISVQQAVLNSIRGVENTNNNPYENYEDLITKAQAESGLTRSDTIKALQNKGDIPKSLNGSVSTTVQKPSVPSEEEALEIWFGKEGEGFNLADSIKKSIGNSLSKAVVNTRVYSKFTDGSGGDLRGVSTNDLNLVVNDNNMYTPRIKAELLRRSKENG